MAKLVNQKTFLIKLSKCNRAQLLLCECEECDEATDQQTRVDSDTSCDKSHYKDSDDICYISHSTQIVMIALTTQIVTLSSLGLMQFISDCTP